MKKTIVAALEVTFLDLFEFLASKKTLEKFIYNVKHQSHTDQFFEEQDPKQWIGSAFVWDTTSETHSFWYNVEKEWCKFLDSQFNREELQGQIIKKTT